MLFARNRLISALMTLLIVGLIYCSRFWQPSSENHHDGPQTDESYLAGVDVANRATGQSSGSADHDTMRSPQRAEWIKGCRVLNEIQSIDSSGAPVLVRLLETPMEKKRVRAVTRAGDDAAEHATLLMMADQMVVKLAKESTEEDLRAWAEAQGLVLRQILPGHSLCLLGLPSADLLEYDGWLRRLNAHSGGPLEIAEPDYVKLAAWVPNDRSFSTQWSLHNSGQTGGKPDADIDAPEAWDVTRGSPSVVVAVLDSGIDTTHPDLIENLWTNPHEVPGNRIDDDQNGYVDDVNGCTVWGLGDLVDSLGHGTHVSGIIAATASNSRGVAGVSPSARVMPVKVMDQDGVVSSFAMATGLQYAASMNVRIACLSFSGPGPWSESDKASASIAVNAGMLLIAAAGNEWANNDITPSYPASSPSPAVIAVGASGHHDQRAVFSNYGARSVDLFAPGVAIPSTAPNGRYLVESGTSAAAPHVAAVCALVASAKPGLSSAAIRNAVLAGADRLPALTGRSVTGGRLNAEKALKMAGGPLLEMAGHTMLDGKRLGASGNGDGLLNPGEDFTLAISIRNTGGQSATQASTQVTISSGSGDVSVVKGSRPWGTLAVGTSVNNNAAPFVLRVAATAVAGAPFTVTFTHTSSSGQSWTEELDLEVSRSSILAGLVKTLTGGKPVAGAIISASGSASGRAVTGKDGRYAMSVPDGSYQITASKAGYETPPPKSLTVDGPATAHFDLGRAHITVTPASLSFVQAEETESSKQLTISNRGDLALVVSVDKGMLSSAITSSYKQLPSYGDAFRPSPLKPSDLPFHEGFEGKLSFQTSRYRDGYSDGSEFITYHYLTDYYLGKQAITTATAAVGARSLMYLEAFGAGPTNGLQKRFSPGTRPKYISFRMRSGSTLGSGCFSLELGGDFAPVPDYSTRFKRWEGYSLIDVKAGSNGRLSTNGDAGGDSSVPYVANQWMHIELRDLDWTEGTYDYWVDGKLRATELSMRGDFEGKQAGDHLRLHLYSDSGEGQSWWDEILVLDEDQAWLRTSTDRVVVAPGQDQTLDVTASSIRQRPGKYSARLYARSTDPTRPVVTVPVTMTVTPAANTAPVVASRTVVLTEDEDAVFNLTAMDAEGNPVTFSLTSLPKNGELFMPGSIEPLKTLPVTLQGPSASLRYVPRSNLSGAMADTFSYIAKDYRLTSPAASVTLSIASINDLPVAGDDTFSMDSVRVLASLPVLFNDSDPDGGNPTVRSVTQGQLGRVAINRDGTLSYTPSAALGRFKDQFMYEVMDAQGGSSTGTVTVFCGPLSGKDWPTLGGDMGHSGFYPGTMGAGRFRQVWSAAIGHSMQQVAIADGRVFAATKERSWSQPSAWILALDAISGRELWRQEPNQTEYASVPCVVEGEVFLQATGPNNTPYYSFSSQTGAMLRNVWSFAFQRCKTLVVKDGIVASVSSTSYGPSSGFLIRNLDFPTAAVNLPNVPPEAWACMVSNSAAVATADGFAEWALDGSYLGSTAAGNTEPLCLPILANGRMWGRFGGRLVGVPTRSSGLTARVDCGPVVCKSPPAVGDRLVAVLGQANGELLLFNAHDGKQLQKLTAPVALQGQPLLAADVVIASSASQTFVFSTADGILLQTLPTGGELSLGDGVLITTSRASDGTITAYRAALSSENLPVANAIIASGQEDLPLTLTLGGSDPDGGGLTAVVTSLPSAGRLYQTADGINALLPISTVPAVVENAQGKLIFQPQSNSSDSPLATFTFQVHDGVFASASASAVVNITAVNDQPRVVDDHYFVHRGSSLSLSVLANDSDLEDTSLTVQSHTLPAAGTLTGGAGTLTYSPDPAAAGSSNVGFQYTVVDSGGLTAVGNVSITTLGAPLGATPQSRWPMQRNTMASDNRYDGSVGMGPYATRWSTPARSSAPLPKALIAAEGKVFACSPDATTSTWSLAAFDLRTGGEVFRSQSISGDPSIFSLCYMDGCVFTSSRTPSGGASLGKFSAQSGQLVWSKSVNGSKGEIYAGLGKLFTASGSGLSAYDPDNGNEIWTRGLHDFDVPSLALNGGELYSLYKQKLSKINLADGSNLATHQIRAAYNYNAINSLVSTGDKLICMDSSAFIGRLICSFLPASQKLEWSTMSTSIYGECAADGSWLFGPQGNQRVATHSLNDGSVQPTYGTALSSAFEPMPCVVANDVLISGGSSIRIFNKVNQELLYSAPITAQDILAVDGCIVALESGTTIHCIAPVEPSNTPPTAPGGIYSLNEDTSVTVILSASDADGDALTKIVRSLPSSGTLYQTPDGVNKASQILRLPASVQDLQGRLIYEPAADANGNDIGNFAYSVHDDSSFTAGLMVINVTPTADPPLVQPDVFSLEAGESLARMRPQHNDSDPDGETLTVTALTQPSWGSVALQGDGSVSFNSGTGLAPGSTTFHYTIADPTGRTAQGSVELRLVSGGMSQWTSAGAEPGRSRFVPEMLAGKTFVKRWSAGAAHSVVIAEGNCFASGSQTSAFDVRTGGIKWQREDDSTLLSWADERLVFDNLCVNASNGEALALIGRQSAFLVDEIGILASSSFSWEPTIGGYDFNGMLRFTLSEANGSKAAVRDGVIWTTFNRTLIARNRMTGVVIQSWPLPNTAPSGVTISGDFAVVHCNLNVRQYQLVCINLASGGLVWSVPTGNWGGESSLDVAVANGRVFSLSPNKVECRDLLTGELLVTCSSPSSFTSTPIATSDSVICGNRWETAVFDLRTGTLRQTIPGSPLAFADQALFISHENALHCYAAAAPSDLAPTVLPQDMVINEDQSLVIQLQASDNGPPTRLKHVITALPTTGTLYQTHDGVTPGAKITLAPLNVLNPQGKVVYLPLADRNGPVADSFRFAAADRVLRSQEAVVSVSISPVDDLPTARDDVRHIAPGQILSPVGERENDFDVDGDSFETVAFTQPDQGTVALNTDGSLRYEPAADVGPSTTSFQYTIQTASGTASTATCTIVIKEQDFASWPMLGNGPDHSGFAPVSLGSGQFTLLWQDSEPAISSVIHDSVLYTTQSGAVVARNLRTGDAIWRIGRPGYQNSAPTWFEGRLHWIGFKFNESRLMVAQASNGSLLLDKIFPSSNHAYMSPLALPTGIYTAGASEHLYCHSEVGGSIFVRDPTPTRQGIGGDAGNWTPAFHNGVLYTSVNGRLNAHSPLSGNIFKYAQLGSDQADSFGMGRTLALAGNTACLVLSSGELVAVRLSDFSVLWRKAGTFSGTPAIAQGRVYCPHQSLLVAYDLRTGQELETLPIPGTSRQPVILNDAIIAAAIGGTTSVLRQSTVTQTLPRSGDLAFANGTLAITGTSGTTVFRNTSHFDIAFSPPPGTYTGVRSITLTSTGSGVQIHYTTDGTSPTLSSPSIQSGSSIVISSSAEIRTFAKSGSRISPVFSGDYTITQAMSAASVKMASRAKSFSPTVHTGQQLANEPKFSVTDFERLSGSTRARLVWSTETGKHYQVECSTDLRNWTPVSPLLPGVGGSLTFDVEAGAERCFFRVRQESP